MTRRELEKAVARFKAGPLVELDARSQEFKAEDLVEISRHIEHECQMLARIAAYLSTRCACGSDQGHETAVKEQNRVAAGVRKALGYTRPRYDLNF